MEQALDPRLGDTLLRWYNNDHRDLPWRRTRDPYAIWISEIMLQQTRVEAVLGYYHRFLTKLPDLQALADCSEPQLLKLWEGLGYYSRVRNMQKCARHLLEYREGRFPQTAPELEKLPGIGPYTAGAIASIAFGKPAPAIDGNVLRVVTRLTRDDTPIDKPALKNRIHELLLPLYRPGVCGEMTQALMELGATVCLPGSPKCQNCPCREFCRAAIVGDANLYPVRPEKKPRRQEKLTVFLLRCGEHTAIRRRGDTGLLASLWEFPNVSGHLSPAEAIAWAQKQGLEVTDIRRSTEKTHIFTHIQWQMLSYLLEVRNTSGDLTWPTIQQLDSAIALPTAFKQFREELDHV